MKNKKVLIGILITAFAILIASGVWFVRKQEKISTTQQQISLENKPEPIQALQFQPQQIPEDQLVWYEIPELGIKFKVTPDAKEDLKYTIVKYSEIGDTAKFPNAVLYLQSVRDFLGQEKCNPIDRCAEFVITRLPNNYCENRQKNGGPDWCAIVLNNDKYEFNLYRYQQAPRFSSGEEGMKYATTVRDKNLGFFQHYGNQDLLKKTYYPFSDVKFINK